MTVTPAVVDSRGMWDATLGLPEQVVAAAEAAREVDGLPGHDDVENVVVLGMGDSGIVGEAEASRMGPASNGSRVARLRCEQTGQAREHQFPDAL